MSQLLLQKIINKLISLLTIMVLLSFSSKESESIGTICNKIIFSDCIETQKKVCFESSKAQFGILTIEEGRSFFYFKMKESNVNIVVQNYNWYNSKSIIDTLEYNINLYTYNLKGEILWRIYQIDGLVESIRFYNNDCSRYTDKLYSEFFPVSKTIDKISLDEIERINKTALSYKLDYKNNTLNYFLKGEEEIFKSYKKNK